MKKLLLITLFIGMASNCAVSRFEALPTQEEIESKENSACCDEAPKVQLRRKACPIGHADV